MNDWKTELGDVLDGYFGYQLLEKGVAAMIGVTKRHSDYHQRYRTAIAAGIAAARARDESVIAIIGHSLAADVRNTDEARAFLERLLSEYDAQFAAATGGASA